MIPKRECFRTTWRYWMALASEACFLPLKGMAQVMVPRGTSAPPSWRQLLLIGNDHIGDVLYTTASLPHLAGGLPQCRIDFLCAPPADQVLANNPFLRHVIIRDHEGEWMRRVRATSYDAILCYNTMHHIGDLWVGLRARIANRVGYAHKGFSAWATYPLPVRYPQPFAAYFRDAVALLTGQAGSWPLTPLVYPLPEEAAAADRALGEVGLSTRGVRVACFCGSRQPRGTPPPEMFAAVLKGLCEARPDCLVALMGAGDDRPALDLIRKKACPEAAVMAGTLSLGTLVEVLKRCDLVLTADSGPRHLANAVGTPVAFFRNVCVSKEETGSYGCPTEVDLVASDIEFLPVEQQAAFWSDRLTEAQDRVVPVVCRLVPPLAR